MPAAPAVDQTVSREAKSGEQDCAANKGLRSRAVARHRKRLADGSADDGGRRGADHLGRVLRRLHGRRWQRSLLAGGHHRDRGRGGSRSSGGRDRNGRRRGLGDRRRRRGGGSRRTARDTDRLVNAEALAPEGPGGFRVDRRGRAAQSAGERRNGRCRRSLLAADGHRGLHHDRAVDRHHLVHRHGSRWEVAVGKRHRVAIDDDVAGMGAGRSSRDQDEQECHRKGSQYTLDPHRNLAGKGPKPLVRGNKLVTTMGRRKLKV